MESVSKALKVKPIQKTAAKISEISKTVKKPAKSRRKTTRHGKGKGINKCILKIMKQGEQGSSNEGKIGNVIGLTTVSHYYRDAYTLSVYSIIIVTSLNPKYKVL